MPRARVFRPGRPIEGLMDLVQCIEDGCWIYWQGRPKHPAVMAALQLSTLRLIGKGGRVFVALRIAEHGEAPE